MKFEEYSDDVVNVAELFEALEEKYGDAEDDCGCYIGQEWLSLKQITDMVKMLSFRD